MSKKKNIYKPVKSVLLHFDTVEEAVEEFKEEFTQAVKSLLMCGTVFSVHPFNNKFDCRVGEDTVNEHAGYILSQVIEDAAETESPTWQDDIKSRICQLLVAYNSDTTYSEWDAWSSEWDLALWEFYNSSYWPSGLYDSHNVKDKVYERLTEDLIEKGTVRGNTSFSKEFFLNYDWLSSNVTFRKGKRIINIWGSTLTNEVLVEVINEN